MCVCVLGGWLVGVQHREQYVKGWASGLTISTLLLVHVSYLDGKGNLAPQGSGKGWFGIQTSSSNLHSENGASNPLMVLTCLIFPGTVPGGA